MDGQNHGAGFSCSLREVSEALSALRVAVPLVQCITNEVTTNFMANAILAIGGSPAMAADQGEADDFIAIASALLVNVGTLSSDKRVTIPATTHKAHALGKPWVLDPVAVGVLQPRTRLAKFILEFKPSIIRGNASEIIALAGGVSSAKGVDARDDPRAALASALSLQERYGSVVAISGASDIITDGSSVITTPGGSAMSTRVTGMGCSLGGVMAAFAASAANALVAAVSACVSYNIAQEEAARLSEGPGTFQPRFLDALYQLEPQALSDAERFAVREVSEAEHAEAASITLSSSDNAVQE